MAPEAYAARRDILGSEMPLLPMTAGEDTELSVTRALELALDPNHGVSWWEYTRYTLIDAADDEVLDEQYVPLNEFDAMSPPTEDTGAMTPAERRQFKQLESRLSKSTDAPQDALIRVRLRQWLAVSDLVQYSELFEHNQFFVPLDRAFDK